MISETTSATSRHATNFVCRERIRPDQDVKAEGRPFAQQLGKQLVGGGGLVLVGRGEAEILLLPPQHAIALQTVNEKVNRGCVSPVGVEASACLVRDFGNDFDHLAPRDELRFMRQHRGDFVEPAGQRRLARASVEDEEPRRARRVLGVMQELKQIS